MGEDEEVEIKVEDESEAQERKTTYQIWLWRLKTILATWSPIANFGERVLTAAFSKEMTLLQKTTLVQHLTAIAAIDSCCSRQDT